MKNTRLWYLLTFLVLVSGINFGEVSTKVYLRDSNELLVPVEVNTSLQYMDYGQIMVGTELAIVINSDLAEHWSGRLLIEGGYDEFGILYGRDPYDDFGNGYIGSILPAAGPFAAVFPAASYWDEEGKFVQGFDFYGDYPPDVNAGDWYVIDYNAIAVGDANIAFYWQQDYPPFEYGMIYSIKFLQVPTRDFSDYSQADFNKNKKVDFSDFSLLASYWKDSNCIGPDWCDGTDINTTGEVDANDLMIFIQFWLDESYLSQNSKVDFSDFSLLASHWKDNDCTDPDWCDGTDINISGSVDMNDLVLFTEFWLEKTK